MASNFSFSSLVAGSSRRRRVMMNELVAQRLDLPDSQDITEQTEQQRETKESHPSETHSDFGNWVVSLNRKPATHENNSTQPEEIDLEQSLMISQIAQTEVAPEIDESLFSKLVSLSESEQILEETPQSEEEKKIGNRQFDNLLEQMPEIAEAVNSLESTKVQREVMAALVSVYEQEQSPNKKE